MEAVLRDDPAGAYARMTFATRDQYRHVVERIAQRTGRDEAAVGGGSSSDFARGAPRRQRDRSPPRARGLLSRGRGARRARARHRVSARRRGTRCTAGCVRHPNVVFVGGMLVGTVVALAAVLWLAGAEGRAAWPAVLLFALLPANDIAVNVMNQLVTAFLPPRVLPKLDLSQPGGVPPELRTAVVIPTLFDSVEAVREALEHLEVQYLANREAHLHFAVLSDFTDAGRRSRPSDAAILEAAASGVRELNAATPDGDRRRVLSLPSAAALEPGAGRVDGLGAEAGEARRVQPVPAGRLARGLLHDRGRYERRSTTFATSSPSTPTRSSRRKPRRSWSGRWPTRSTAPSTTRIAGAWCAATASSSRAWACRCRAPTGRTSPRSSPGTPASTRTRPPCPTCIRICTARAASPARASTTSTRSSRPRTAASPRTSSCRTT